MNEELAALIARIQQGENLNALAIQREISALWDELDTEADRVDLLHLHRAFMDLVERTGGLTAEALARFQGVRESEYRLFLTKEAMADGENVDPDLLDLITRREVEAGRMAPDSDFRTLAQAGSAVLGLSPKSKKKGWLRELFG